MDGRRRDVLLVLGLAALAVVLRVASWAATPAIFNDGPAFLGIARAMAAGEWGSALEHDYHPLYSFATLLVQLLRGAPDVSASWERSAVTVSIAAGAASVVLLYALLRRLFDRGVAAVGALVLAVHPTAVRHASDVQSDGLYLALFLAAALAGWVALEGRRAGVAAWAGALAGLAYLVRPEGLGPLLVVGGVAALRTWQGRWRPFELVPFGVALAAGALLVMTPYLVVVRVDTGAWQMTKKKSVTRLAGAGAPYYPPEEEAASGAAPAPGGAAPLVASPAAPGAAPTAPTPAAAPAAPAAHGASLPRPLRAVGELVRESVASVRYEVVAFVLLGLWARRGRPGDAGVFVGAHVALYAVVLYALALNAGYVSKRHVLPPATLLFGYAAIGVPVLGGALVAAGRRIGRIAGIGGTGAAGARGPAPRALALGLGLAVLLPFALGKQLRRGGDDTSGAQREAAEWLREQGLARGPVAADKVRVAYYADAPFVSLRDARAPLLPWLRERGARYVITDTEALSEEPALGAGAAELELIHEVAGGGGVARVFAVPPADDRREVRSDPASPAGSPN